MCIFKKLNRFDIMSFMLVSVVIFAAGCVGNRTNGICESDTERIVESINANSNFGEILLLEQVSPSLENYDVHHSPHVVPLIENSSSYATAGKYPYNSEEVRYTQINILDDRFNLFGATVGHSFDDIEKVLLNNSFSKMELVGELAPYKTAFPTGALYICANVRIVVIRANDENAVIEIFINVLDPDIPQIDGAY